MKTIEEIRAAFLKIHHHATGTKRDSYMSIPADPQRDADLIVDAAIDELAKLRDEVATVRRTTMEKCAELAKKRAAGLEEDGQLAGKHNKRDIELACLIRREEALHISEAISAIAELDEQ